MFFWSRNRNCDIHIPRNTFWLNCIFGFCIYENIYLGAILWLYLASTSRKMQLRHLIIFFSVSEDVLSVPIVREMYTYLDVDYVFSAKNRSSLPGLRNHRNGNSILRRSCSHQFFCLLAWPSYLLMYKSVASLEFRALFRKKLSSDCWSRECELHGLSSVIGRMFARWE